MAFGLSVRAKRTEQGIGLNDFAERLGVSPAYLVARRARAGKSAARRSCRARRRDPGVRMDDLFVEAGRLPPDMRGDLRQVVQAY